MRCPSKLDFEKKSFSSEARTMSDSFVSDSSTDSSTTSQRASVMLECGLEEDSRGSQLERPSEDRRTFSEAAPAPFPRSVHPATGATAASTRSRSMVWRTSIVACAFIICVHLLVVWSVDVAPTIDRIARQGAAIVAPVVVHQVAPSSRAKRHLAEEEGGERRRRAEELSQEKRRGDGNDPMSISPPSPSSSSSSICRSGHIQGLSALCSETQPCLRRLHRPNTQPHPPSSSPFSSSSSAAAAAHEATSAEVLRRISHISGRLDSVHLSLVPFLSEFQWKNGIYGSVGEFGVSLGKFTTLLSIYTDVDAGERLFVCDSFNGSSTSGGAGHHGTIAGLSSFQVFTAHMRDFGFDEEASAGPKRRLHLHRGSTSTLDRRLFSAWDLPQFRLISIDAAAASDLDRLSVLWDLETASCLLRDGGLIIVNGVHDDETRQLTTSTMVNYFGKHGQSALTPILSTGNKLYLTTTNWRRKYIEALSHDVILTHSGLIQGAFIAPLTNDQNEQTPSDAL